MKIRSGDTVAIIAGKEKGKSGRVLRVIHSQNRVVVEGLNMRVRHIKRTPQQAGQRVQFEAALAISNVMLVDPKTKKPTRVGYTVDKKTGRKDRVAKKSKEIIKGVATTAPTKGAKKPAGEQKKAFWDRGSSKPEDMSEAKGQRDHVEHNVTHTMPKASRSENG